MSFSVLLPDPWRVQVVGIAINLIPGRDASGRPWTGTSEVQRAPDSGGSPGAWVTIADDLPPLPSAGAPFVDQLPATTARWHYRWRHKGPGVGAGNFSSSVSALPDLIPKSVLATAINTGRQVSVYPIMRAEPMTDGDYAVAAASGDGKQVVKEGKIEGQTRTLVQVVTYLVPNAEFDVWESASQPHAWSVNTGDSSVAAKDTTVVFSGDASAKFSFGAGGSAGTYRGFTSNDPTKGSFCVPYRPGVPYTLKIATRVSSIASAPGYRITINHNAARTLQSIKTVAFRAANAWQLDEFTFVVPAGAEANSEVLVEFTRGSTNATDFWCDSIRNDELEVKELYDNGTKTSAFTIDWGNGPRQKVTLGASSLVCTFINAVPGAKNTLLIQQDSTGSRLVPVFDSVVMWENNNTTPTLSTGAGLTDELAFVAQTSPTLRYYATTVALAYLLPSPGVINVTPTPFGTASVNHNVGMPATVVAGRLLLQVIAWAAAPGGVTTPSGWTNGGTTSIGSVFYKVSDGTEGGTTVNVITGNSVKAAAQTYQVDTWYGAVSGVEVALNSGAPGTSADPSSKTPAWGADRNMWIAGVAVTANPALTDPGSYGNFQQTDDGSVAVRLRTGRRALYAATEDPAAFTWTGSQTWTAFTIAIRPPA